MKILKSGFVTCVTSCILLLVLGCRTPVSKENSVLIRIPSFNGSDRVYVNGVEMPAEFAMEALNKLDKVRVKHLVLMNDEKRSHHTNMALIYRIKEYTLAQGWQWIFVGPSVDSDVHEKFPEYNYWYNWSPK